MSLTTIANNTIHVYSGSLTNLYAGSILGVSVLNGTSAGIDGVFVDNNGQLTTTDTTTTVAINGGATQSLTYLGSGTVSMISILGIKLDARPVAIFSAGGQTYLYAPEGLPLVSGLSISFDINPTAPFTIATASNGVVDGLDTGQSMSLGYTDLQGDQITNAGVRVFGNGGNDTITGGSGADTISGGDGADTVYGGAGNDSLTGDAGGDRLEGGLGDDTLLGGDGADRLILDEGVDRLWGDAGDDTFSFGTNSFGTDSVIGSESSETLGDLLDASALTQGAAITFYDAETGTLAQGGNTLTFTETERFIFGSGNDTITGSAGNERLDAGGGHDLISGGAGADTLAGGAGNDTISGGAGADSLTGGAGDDLFRVSNGDGGALITDFDTGDSDANGYFNDQIDVSALTDPLGAPVTIWNTVVSDDGAGNARLTFPNGETLTLQGVSPSALQGRLLLKAGVPCFTAGTLIDTPRGAVPVESLRAGDLVCTRDNGPQRLLWAARRDLTEADLARAPNLRPVMVKPSGAPALIVSPQHGILWRHGGEERLVRAVQLTRLGAGIARIMHGRRAVSYIHLMFESHQVVTTQGVASESFYPGARAVAAADIGAQREFAELFPALYAGFGGGNPEAAVRAIYRAPARPYARWKEVIDAEWAFATEGLAQGVLG